MSEQSLKDQLKSDLTVSMKARDELRSATLRMVLTAVTNEEVSGKEARTLSDADVITVLSRESKKRKEAAQAYEDASRPELAERELAEQAIIAAYLPKQLSDDEIKDIVAAAIQESGASGMGGMGAVMKIVQPKVVGQADGGRVAAEVKAQLSAG